MEMVSEGSPGHGPVHLLSASAAEVGFGWDPLSMGWTRPGLPLVSNLAGPVQHFKAAFLDAWRNEVAADLCGRKGFRCGPLLDAHGSLQHLSSSHVRERDKALGEQLFPCRFCDAPDGDGHFFGTVHLLILLRFVKILSFMIS